MSTFIQHVTLNTGHNKPYNRFECRPETIKGAKALISAALEQDLPLSMPSGELAHLAFACVAEGRKLTITVFAPMGPHTKGQPFRYNGKNGAPIAICGIAPKSKDAKLWDMLLDTYSTVYPSETIACERPQASWLGVIVTPLVQQFPESLTVLADFERCMAWAWLEILKEQA